MIKITAIAPEINQVDVHPDLVIESINDYVRCYSMIREHIHLIKDFHVVVTDTTTARWLQVMARKYGPEVIQYNELNLRKLIEDRINLKIPGEISDQAIRESGLVDLKIPASGQASLEEYLLEVFFGSFMNKQDMIFRVNEIQAVYEPGQWQLSLDRPLVKKVYQARLSDLKASMKSNGEKLLLDWFEKSPEEYFRNLSALKLLTNYPVAMGTRLFGRNYKELNQLGLDLRKLPVITKGNEKVLDEIQIFLQKAGSRRTADELQEIMDQVSGFLETELDCVLNIIKAGDIEVNKALIQRIRRKFTGLQSLPHIAQVLTDLDQLISVSPPTEPQEAWAVDDWLKWAVDEYLPYRFWLENTGKLNDEIGELAGKYSDWLYQNYGQLLYNSNRMAWKATYNLKDRISNHNGPVLLVMVDNLNAKFFPVIQHQLHLLGFYEQDFCYCLSNLPSFTEVGKKSVITAHYEPFKGTGYNQAVEQTWFGKINRRVRYVPNIQELRAINSREQDLYVLNYLPLDMCLHQDENQIGISHTQTIQVYLSALAQDIHSFARRINAERDLMVIITSDHGSTRIPKGTINLIEDKMYKKHAIDEHHRFIAIDDSEVDKLSENVKYDCYLFRKDEFGLPENYLVARRLYRFLPTNDANYIHGGLTPEETIIPVAVFLPVAVVPKPLIIQLIEPKKVLAGTRVDLVFEITNLNNSLVEQVILEVIDPNIEASERTLDSLQKLQRGLIKVDGRCLSSTDITTRKMIVKVSYIFNGKDYENIVEVPVIYDSLLKVKFDLDNL